MDVLGNPWDPIGTLLERLWTRLGHLGTPLGSMWSALGPKGPFGGPIEKQPRFWALATAFENKIIARSPFWALEAGATGVVSKTVARTPLPTHAEGQDDVSLERTPSN